MAQPAGPASMGRPPPDDAEVYAWEPETHSPRVAAPEADDRMLLQRCGQTDTALRLVAARVARRQAQRLPALDIPEISFALRAAGSPYVWARAWTVEGARLDDAEVAERAQRWLDSFDDGGERRCGFGRARTADGGTVFAALALDVAADLESLPTRGRLGQWLTVEAHTFDRPSDAQVVVLGPRGAPRAIPTSVDGKTVRASFSADRPGSWLVQVLADVGSGPRPVAEAMVHVDTEPPTAFRAAPVPGETAAQATDADAAALERMVNAARRSEGLLRLRRDPRLDAVAQAHAESMRKARLVGHDVGSGSLPERIEAANLIVKMAGENLARAMDIRRAHRALWASPSHRANLLEAKFRSIGIGVVPDEDGTLWVCEVFATF